MGIEWSAMNYNSFPLHEAVKKSDVHAVEALLKKGNIVNCKDSSTNGLTPLQYAVQKDNYELAKILIEHSALVEKTGGELGQTSLHHAIENDCSIALIELLIQNGKALNVKDSRGNTPIHYAAYYGRISVVRELIRNGALINELNSSSKTPLDIARDQQCTQCVQMLYGAEETGN